MAVTMRTHRFGRYDNSNDVDNDVRGWYESDLQLAAELGKTLLERNHDLETNLRQQQLYIEEKDREVVFLTRQLSALRDVNESRLKLYEQLETSISEFDRSNQKLQQESEEDRKKIKSLSNTVSFLEKRCEELQDMVEELKSANENEKQLSMKQNAALEQEVLDSFTEREFLRSEQENPYEEEMSKLKASLSRAKSQVAREQRLREELELDVNLLLQENSSLQDQLECYRDKLLHWCNGCNPDQVDCYNTSTPCHNCCQRRSKELECYLQSDFDDDPVSKEEWSLFQLKNGMVAYGKEDSLISVGSLLEGPSDDDTGKGTSLLNELDAQYRFLIEKYETMVDSRIKQCEETSALSENALNIEMHSSQPLYGEEEHSSGFSESSDQSLTDNIHSEGKINKVLDLSSASNPVNDRFNHSPPEYKKLFAEIFSVLKRSMPNENSVETSLMTETPKETMSLKDNSNEIMETPNATIVKTEKTKTEKRSQAPKVISGGIPSLNRSQRRPNQQCSRILPKTAGDIQVFSESRRAAFSELRARFENDCAVRIPNNKTYAEVLKGRHVRSQSTIKNN